MTLDMMTATLFVVGYLFLEILRQLAGLIFRRIATPNYVTHKEFDSYSDKKEETFEELRRDLKNIRQLLLVIAQKAGIPNEDLRELVS